MSYIWYFICNKDFSSGRCTYNEGARFKGIKMINADTFQIAKDKVAKIVHTYWTPLESEISKGNLSIVIEPVGVGWKIDSKEYFDTVIKEYRK